MRLRWLGTAGFAGDTGVATLATMNNPHGIAVGPDNSLYIADNFNYRVRRSRIRRLRCRPRPR